MDFLSLEPEQFESMTFDIVSALGLKNAVWRTPGSDLGRDIEGSYFISDLSGHYQCQKWYVECKRYTNSVDWPTVWEKISYAETHCADILLFVTSTTLSPQAIDQVRRWNENGRKPIIRFWGKIEITSKLNLYPQIAKKYGLKLTLDSNADIFYPSMLLLVKISGSMSVETKPIPDDKLRLSHTLSELILTRMADVKLSGKFDYRTHEPSDYLDFVEYPQCGLKNFDKYSTRTLLSYLKFIFKDKLSITYGDGCNFNLTIPRDLIDSERDHIQTITALSNFTAVFERNKITISLISRDK